MISTHDIQKMIKQIARRDEGLPDRQLIHPKREWVIIVFVCVKLLIVGGGFAIYTFNIYSDITIASSEVDVQTTPYKRADTYAALEAYTARSESFEALVSDIVAPIQVLDQTLETESGIEIDTTDPSTDVPSEESIQPVQDPENASEEDIVVAE